MAKAHSRAWISRRRGRRLRAERVGCRDTDFQQAQGRGGLVRQVPGIGPGAEDHRRLGQLRIPAAARQRSHWAMPPLSALKPGAASIADLGDGSTAVSQLFQQAQLL